MNLGWFSFLRFHFLRLFSAQPLVVGGLVSAAFSALVASFVYWHEASLVRAEAHILSELRSRTRAGDLASKQPTAPAFVAPALPWFQGADMVAKLNRIADNAALPVDEVGYELDVGTNQPYMRYRVTMTVTASYPAIRRFTRDVTAAMNNVDLDAISCTRSDINVVALNCDLGFSAFFRKDAHG